MSISGHKICGPQGIGALFVRRLSGRQRPLSSITFGGGQERGLRPGTIPVPLVVGLGEAARIALESIETRQENAAKNRTILLSALASLEHSLNGDQERCQSHVLNVQFPGVDSEALMMATSELLAFSNGSACTSADYKLSHVLTAMQLDEDECSESIRLSWSDGCLADFCETLISAVKRIESQF